MRRGGGSGRWPHPAACAWAASSRRMGPPPVTPHPCSSPPACARRPESRTAGVRRGGGAGRVGRRYAGPWPRAAAGNRQAHLQRAPRGLNARAPRSPLDLACRCQSRPKSSLQLGHTGSTRQRSPRARGRRRTLANATRSCSAQFSGTGATYRMQGSVSGRGRRGLAGPWSRAGLVVTSDISTAPWSSPRWCRGRRQALLSQWVCS